MVACFSLCVVGYRCSRFCFRADLFFRCTVSRISRLQVFQSHLRPASRAFYTTL